MMRTPLLYGTCPRCQVLTWLCGQCGTCEVDALHDACSISDEPVHGDPNGPINLSARGLMSAWGALSLTDANRALAQEPDRWEPPVVPLERAWP